MGGQPFHYSTSSLDESTLPSHFEPMPQGLSYDSMCRKNIQTQAFPDSAGCQDLTLLPLVLLSLLPTAHLESADFCCSEDILTLSLLSSFDAKKMSASIFSSFYNHLFSCDHNTVFSIISVSTFPFHLDYMFYFIFYPYEYSQAAGLIWGVHRLAYQTQPYGVFLSSVCLLHLSVATLSIVHTFENRNKQKLLGIRMKMDPTKDIEHYIGITT